MKEETLEKAAKNYANIPLHRDIDSEERYFNSNVREYDSFIAGAKWQQEQDKNKYSEEEVRQMLWELGDVLFNNNQNGIEEGDPEKYFDGIIEQFKNQEDGND
jgi:hypothetical protein